MDKALTITKLVGAGKLRIGVNSILDSSIAVEIQLRHYWSSENRHIYFWIGDIMEQLALFPSFMSNVFPVANFIRV